MDQLWIIQLSINHTQIVINAVLVCGVLILSASLSVAIYRIGHLERAVYALRNRK